MSTFCIPILPFFVHIFLKTTQLSCRKTIQLNLSSKIKANAGEKQLNSSVGTKQLNSTRQHERNNSTGENNSTQQQERTTQLGNRNETTQLASRNETTQLCTAVDRLQPPAPPLQQNRLFLPTPGLFIGKDERRMHRASKKRSLHQIDMSEIIDYKSRCRQTYADTDRVTDCER
ncbi:hypothetical protein TNCV_4538051 [Trichonephila clavipes]|nr:hypothetical protein TNCV_4538051 [Trichonephila clavipes]